MIKTGLERLLTENRLQESLAGLRIGLLANQASTGRNFRYAKDLLKTRLGGQLTCLFSPQHGFFSEKQDNMIESAHGHDQAADLPVFSLYGETRRPTAEMYDLLDLLLIDLADVGARVYTFMYTVAYCLEAAARHDKKVVVLDRPNPVGGIQVEGNILEEELKSFVGLYPIPMRHGMTLAELALYMNAGIGAELEIIKMQGWQREMYFDQTGLPWLAPSPNMPTLETALVYPGQVIWEGTNVSEARGTTRPFELFGAPSWNHDAIMEHIGNAALPGCYFRPLVFEPTSGKFAGQSCNGFQLHVTERQSFMPYRTSLALLQAAILTDRQHFAYKKPPYEYEYEKLPLDIILGSLNL
ncbi:MAG: hypothetical protein CSB24_05980, partial [Deltaproteobacteria bacterium]